MKERRKSSDKAFDRQNFLLSFLDSSCRFDKVCSNSDTIESLKRKLEEYDEAIADWESIISYDDSQEVIRLNRAGLQRCKTEKKYIKQKLKEMISKMDKTMKSEVAYSA